MAYKLFATKSIEKLQQEAADNEHGLYRALTAKNLVALGVGAIIGAGIFVITGQAAAQYSGPAIVLSFLVSGLACAFAGLCYAEFAAMIPISGSAYTYAYSTLGEFIAWMIGWDLILEYLFAASTVAVGWSGYVVSFLNDFGVHFPAYLTAASGQILVDIPGEGWKTLTKQLSESLTASGIAVDTLPRVTAIMNLPSMFIVAALTVLLILGIRKSAKFNNLMVFIKVTVIIIFIAIGFSFIKSSNLHPFIPENTGEFGFFGLSGILRGAGVIFFAYIGFDAVSTAAQESKNPQRDMPIGILGSLGISTLLYVLVAIVLTGIVHYTQLNVADPVAVGVNAMGESMFWLRPIVKLAAIAGLSSVILVLLMGQPRIFFSIAKDGILPKSFAKVHPTFKTPWISQMATGLVAIILAGILPIDVLGKLVSIGTLFAFVIVCLSVIILRKTRPEIPRPFRTPWVPVIPILGALICLAQMLALPLPTWIMFISWVSLGIIIYFVYSRRHSKVQKEINNK